MTDNQASGRRHLILLALLFMGPLALAWILYFAGDGWRPSGSAAHGELINPPVALDEVPTAFVQGDAPDGLFRKVWSFAVVAPEGCTEECMASLVKVRQIRLTLTKERERVARVLIAPYGSLDTGLLATEHAGLVVADANEPVTGALVDRFPGARASENWIYLVDPLGNLMMRFTADAPSNDIRDDLRRLLKLSRIG